MGKQLRVMQKIHFVGVKNLVHTHFILYIFLWYAALLNLKIHIWKLKLVWKLNVNFDV